MMSERLALVHIADVHLDEGDVDAGQRVPDRDAGVCECAWVNHDGFDLVDTCLVYPVDYGAFPVGLEVRELDVGGFALGFGC